jgi:sulfur carrier protein ThiS
MLEKSDITNKIMTAKIILRKKEYIIRHGMTIRSALIKIGIQPESVLPTRDGGLVSEEEIILDGDVIKLVSVISGG